MDRSIIDVASGALGDMTPLEAKSLIEKMTSNSQQFNGRRSDAIVVRSIHDVGTNVARQDNIKSEIDSLSTLITQLAMNQQKPSLTRVYGNHNYDHPEAYVANVYNNRPPQQQQNYDSSSSTYNPVAPPKWTIFTSTKPQNSSKPSSCFMVTHLEKLGGEKATMEVGGDEGRCGSFAEQRSLRNLSGFVVVGYEIHYVYDIDVVSCVLRKLQC
ncbi:hypothetical protein Lal_00027256 [Lupinus albus]|nr:hypothetical protein Lal_00027256 [Lupinus albus]